jgi:hypothetical protein
MNVFYNGSIQARKIVGIKNSFMLGEEPNGNYVFTFDDGSQQEISWEFMDKWSVPKPSLLAGTGLKEGQIIADVDSDNEAIETNLILGYFLEFEDGRTSYVCQKVFDAWYLNQPTPVEQLEEDWFEDNDSPRNSNEIYNRVEDTGTLVVESKLEILNTIGNLRLGLVESINLLEKMNFRAESMVYFMKGMAIMEVVLFVLLLISLFS